MGASAAARKAGEKPEMRKLLPRSAVEDVARALKTIRAHLDMDVAFVSEFMGDNRIFRHVDTKGSRKPIHQGDVISLEEGYCRKIVEGRLPQLIPDTSTIPEAMAIPATHAVPIGSHLSVPLRLADGRIYGTFCCFSFMPDGSLNERDLQMMRAVAELIAHQIDDQIAFDRAREEKSKRIQAILVSSDPSMVYQPVFSLADMAIVGAEALARFHSEPCRSPDRWFAESAEVGMRSALELKAIRSATEGFEPARRLHRLGLGLNASPNVIIAGGILEALGSFPPEQVVLEITEHEHVEDYTALMEALRPIRARGVKIAVDDAGSGYASMRHILHIRPDFIKLDTSLTKDIHSDTMKRALAAALIEFGARAGCHIVAEGVETEAEIATLRELGVHKAQGFYVGRPMPIDAFVTALRQQAGRNQSPAG